ncbi:MAG TPA: TIGR02588 family protein [Rubricoccaceae bacterium]|nr:TIGR02588 family protein [Rubricoccaceae bacterium]
MAAAKPRHPEHHDETSPLEWALAAASALLVLGVIGFLLYEAAAEPPTPPAVTVDVVGVRPSGNGYVVEFEAHNEGGETAARLTVEGTLVAGAEEVEASEATLDYVPAGGRRGGGLFFTRDPRAYRLDLRPTGYARP